MGYLPAVVTSESKLFAFLAYFFGVIGFVIVLVTRRDDPFAMYHAKQALVLLLTGIVVGFLGGAIAFVGIFVGVASGNPLAFIGLFTMFWLFAILMTILHIIGIVYALTGQERPLPIIGRIADSFKF